MTDLDEFQRWCQEAGHYQITAAIQRFRGLDPQSRQHLRDRWERDDSAPRRALEERRREWN
jgi:hypothetical protein